MDFTTWLKERGRAEALAAHFDISPGAISQWKSNGVPIGQMQAVSEFTGGAVTLGEMALHAVEAKAAKALKAAA